MVEARGERDFTQKPFSASWCRQFRTQHLECHVAIMFQVARLVYRRHTATANYMADAIAVGYDAVEEIVRHTGDMYFSVTDRKQMPVAGPCSNTISS